MSYCNIVIVIMLELIKYMLSKLFIVLVFVSFQE